MRLPRSGPRMDRRQRLGTRMLTVADRIRMADAAEVLSPSPVAVRFTMELDLPLSIDVLARTPATLRTLLDGLAEPWIRGVEGPDTFSPFDVVGHLIDGEETDWMPRARIILSKGGDKRFVPYDRFRHRARNVGRTLPSLLEEFAQLREIGRASCRER